MKKLLALLLTGIFIVNAHAQKFTISVCKDIMTGKYTALGDKDIMAWDEKNNRGFRLWLSFRYKDSTIRYAHFGILSANIGSCMEKDQVLIMFTDSTIYSSTSWNDFNCSGNSYFDINSNHFNKLSKEILAIRFTNGRTNESYTYFPTKEQSRYFIEAHELIDRNEYTMKKCED